MYHVNVTGMMNDRCVLLFFRADRGRRSHVLASDASRGQKRGRMKPDWGHCHQLPRIVRDTVTAATSSIFHIHIEQSSVAAGGLLAHQDFQTHDFL